MKAYINMTKKNLKPIGWKMYFKNEARAEKKKENNRERNIKFVQANYKVKLRNIRNLQRIV